MRYIALILMLIAPSWAGAGSITTQEVLDRFEESDIHLGYVAGVLQGFSHSNAMSESTLGSTLYCAGDTKISTNDFFDIIKGEVAKLNNAQKPKILRGNFATVALIIMQRVYPCE